MKFISQKRKDGFTLIELLIAASIFVIVMMITTATFTWTSAYNGKLREMRNVSQTGRKTMDMISSDIRLANGNVKIGLDTGITAQVSGMLNFYCEGLLQAEGCFPDPYYANIETNFPTILSVDPTGKLADHGRVAGKNANGLLIIMKDQDKYVFYRNVGDDTSSPVNYDLYRYEGSLSVDMPSGTLNLDKDIDPSNSASHWVKMNDSTLSLKIGFAGYAAINSSSSQKKQQPYCNFALRVETRDYSDTSVQSRAQLDLQTSVETRDYN